MIDQLIIGDIASYDDFEANVKERKIKTPKKKSIKETVPFSNKTYDFSKINGEIYWEDRELEYVFEITANTPEELEEKKQAFMAWIMNVSEEELHDPFIQDYHFIATYEDSEPDDSEVEKSTITVKFTAYPYMISDAKRVGVYELTETQAEIRVVNESSHRITPTFICDVEYTLIFGDSSYEIPAGELTDERFMLEPGANTLTVGAVEGSGTLKIEFHEEVF